MTKIGLLSDTHAHFDSTMRAFLEPCDQLWHAGDIGSLSLLDDLRNFKPTVAVFGNIDDSHVRLAVPEFQIFSVEQVKIVMTHIGGYPGRYEPKVRRLLETEKPQIFVSGHSHILKVMYDKQLQCLHLNPGASGLSGFNPKRTMLRFTIDGSNIKDLEVWEKGKNSKENYLI
ncbi:MAG: metallophosphoesterase family protein [Salinivirgaceae bacterium]|nr:metallophosphoesterase family protein [Salinivirgaceae bacterium]